jgi:hypothetical protein
MITMNIVYAKQDEPKPNEVYQTWKWVSFEAAPMGTEVEYGWQKQAVPNIAAAELKEWFDVSNREDLLFLEKEREAFDKWYLHNFKDIVRHIK